MAPSPRFISVLFLLAIFFVQIHARESKFFSKVSAATATPSTTTINNNNAQDKTLPSKEEEEESSKQELDPAFIRDNQNGYGLYGQESTQFPTTTKLADAPYTSTNYQPYKTQNQNQESATNYPTDTTTITNPNTRYYSNNAYEEQQQNFGEKSLEESGYTSTGNQNGNSYYYSGANGYSNDEKPGMSDTRYMEKGKYHYDVNNENSNFNPNQYQYQLQNSRNNYDTRGYYNNNENNENSKYEYNNSMQKYDNQDGFEESKEEQYVP